MPPFQLILGAYLAYADLAATKHQLVSPITATGQIPVARANKAKITVGLDGVGLLMA
jgi:hypothetical protein